MQLPTEEHIPAQLKLSTVISNLPSHRCKQNNSMTETYIGLTENNFKTTFETNVHWCISQLCFTPLIKGYRNHTASFRHAKHRNSTELSKHIWTLNDHNIEHFISWRILSSHSPYNSSSKRCKLWLKEFLIILKEFLIICRPELSTLNKRKEIVSSFATETKPSYATTKLLISRYIRLFRLCKFIVYKQW